MQNNGALLVETGSTLKVDANSSVSGQIITVADKQGDSNGVGVYYVEPGVNIELAQGVSKFPTVKASDVNLTTNDDVTIDSDTLKQLATETDQKALTNAKNPTGQTSYFEKANDAATSLLNNWHIAGGTGTLNVKKSELEKAIAHTKQTTKGRTEELLKDPGVQVDSGATFVTQVSDATEAEPADMAGLVTGQGTWEVKEGHFTATAVPSNVKVDKGASLNVTASSPLNTTLTTTDPTAGANVNVPQGVTDPSTVHVKDNAGKTTVQLNADHANVSVDGNKGTVDLGLTGTANAPITTNVTFGNNDKAANLSLDNATANLSAGASGQTAVKLGDVSANNAAAVSATGASAPKAIGINALTGNLMLSMKIDASQDGTDPRHDSAQVYVMNGTAGGSGSPEATPGAQTGSVVLNYDAVQHPEGLVGKHLRIGVTGPGASIVLKSATDKPMVVEVGGKKYEIKVTQMAYSPTDDSGVNTANDGDFVGAGQTGLRSWYLEAVALTPPLPALLTAQGQLKAFAFSNLSMINKLPKLVAHYVAPVKSTGVTVWAEGFGSYRKAVMFVNEDGYRTKTYDYGVELGLDKAFTHNDSIYRIGLLGQVDGGHTNFGGLTNFKHLQYNVGGYLSYANPSAYFGVSARYVSVLSKSDQKMDFEAKGRAVRMNVETGLILNWMPEVHVKAVPHIQYQYTRVFPQVNEGTYLGQEMKLDMPAMNIHKVRVGIDLTKQLFVMDVPSEGYVGFDFIYTRGLNHDFKANGKTMHILPNTYNVRFSAGLKMNVTDAFALDVQAFDNISLEGYSAKEIEGRLGMSYEF